MFNTPIDSVPTDVLIEILLYIDWRSIVRLRSVSKGFRQVTEQRSLWIHLIIQHQDTDILSSAYEYPLSQYSPTELMQIFLRWKRSEIAWTSFKKRNFTTVSPASFYVGRGGYCFVDIIPGGRWLLLQTYHATLLYMDLNTSNGPRELIPYQLGHRPSDGEVVEGRFALCTQQSMGQEPWSVLLAISFVLDLVDGTQRAEVQLWDITHCTEYGASPDVNGIQATKRTSTTVAHPGGNLRDNFSINNIAVSPSFVLLSVVAEHGSEISLRRLDILPMGGSATVGMSNYGRNFDITTPPFDRPPRHNEILHFVTESVSFRIINDHIIFFRNIVVPPNSGIPPTEVIFAKELPCGLTDTEIDVSTRFEVGSTKRWTISGYNSGEIWGIIVPDTNWTMARPQHGFANSPLAGLQIIPVGTFTVPLTSKSFPLVSWQGYRRAIRYLTRCRMYVMAQLTWPDDADNNESGNSMVSFEYRKPSNSFMLDETALRVVRCKERDVFRLDYDGLYVVFDEISGRLIELWDKRRVGYIINVD